MQPGLGWRDALAAALWVGAFAFEVTADRQKSAWRERKNNKEHDEKFITSGLWGVSRHPNYVGEVSIWAAQAFAAYSLLSNASLASSLALPGAWTPYAVFASPLLEYALIRFVSGVPLLEKKGDEKYGDDPKWQEYKR